MLRDQGDQRESKSENGNLKREEILVGLSLLSVLLLLIGVRRARPGESENTLSVQRRQPHTTNPLKEEKEKTVGDEKERADHENRKALALPLKPASPTPSNTGSL